MIAIITPPETLKSFLSDLQAEYQAGGESISAEMAANTIELIDSLQAESDEAQRLKCLINTPEMDSFLRAVHIEAVHQIEKWGTASDRAKRPADWFWLVGYLSGKALHAAAEGNESKALHHCISTAAALYNWHCAIKGSEFRMCPGRSDLAEIVESSFPGETAEAKS